MADDFFLEPVSGGNRLVVTGRWSDAAEAALKLPTTIELWLNYALGFEEPDLEFIEAWDVASVLVLADLTDLTPLSRLTGVRELVIEASSKARLALDAFPHLQALGIDWRLVDLGRNVPHRQLTYLGVRHLPDVSLERLARTFPALEHLKITEAPKLASLAGVAQLEMLRFLDLAWCPMLADIDDVRARSSTLERLFIDVCRRINSIEPVAALRELRWLRVSDCGDLASIAPLRSLDKLEILDAWGDTKVLDGDLSVLASLPALNEVRMKSRREYKPPLREVRPD
jgi:hypothetical protein